MYKDEIRHGQRRKGWVGFSLEAPGTTITRELRGGEILLKGKEKSKNNFKIGGI